MAESADTTAQLAALHAEENAKSFDEVRRGPAAAGTCMHQIKLDRYAARRQHGKRQLAPSFDCCCTCAHCTQVEADKARRADRLERDPDYDEQQGVQRNFVSGRQHLLGCVPGPCWNWPAVLGCCQRLCMPRRPWRGFQAHPPSCAALALSQATAPACLPRACSLADHCPARPPALQITREIEKLADST